MTKIDEHEKDIKEIQITYINKQDFKEFKDEVSKSFESINSQVGSINKEHLTKKDFLHSQNKTDEKIEKLYDLILKRGEN